MIAPRALLFDLDGTLIDTKEANFAAYRSALERTGRLLDRASFDGTWGMDSRDFLPRLYPGIDPSEVDAIRETKADIYPSYLGRAAVDGDMVDMIRRFHGRTSLALVTTAKRRSVEAAVRRLGLDGLFDVIVSGDDVAASKPSPDPYLLALARLGVEAEACIAFEDSESGAQAARSAGISVVRVAGFS